MTKDRQITVAKPKTKYNCKTSETIIANQIKTIKGTRLSDNTISRGGDFEISTVQYKYAHYEYGIQNVELLVNLIIAAN